MCAAGLDAGIRWLLSFCAMSFPFTLMHKIQMPSVVMLLVDDSPVCSSDV